MNHPVFYAAGGILTRFCSANELQIRRKFKEADTEATSLYETRDYQPGTSGAQSEESHPLYICDFFDYFDFLETRITDNRTT